MKSRIARIGERIKITNKQTCYSYMGLYATVIKPHCSLEKDECEIKFKKKLDPNMLSKWGTLFLMSDDYKIVNTSLKERLRRIREA